MPEPIRKAPRRSTGRKRRMLGWASLLFCLATAALWGWSTQKAIGPLRSTHVFAGQLFLIVESPKTDQEFLGTVAQWPSLPSEPRMAQAVQEARERNVQARQERNAGMAEIQRIKWYALEFAQTQRVPPHLNLRVCLTDSADCGSIRLFHARIALWPAILAFGSLGAILLTSASRARRRATATDACPRCGYPRAGLDNSAPCPECGTL